jgi:hypothetical protein
LQEALAYERHAFEDDHPVDGGDLVEFFAAWRERAKAYLLAQQEHDYPALYQCLKGEALELADLMEGALTTHIYDEQNGDVIPEDSAYVLAVKGVRDAAEV